MTLHDPSPLFKHPNLQRTPPSQIKTLIFFLKTLETHSSPNHPKINSMAGSSQISDVQWFRYVTNLANRAISTSCWKADEHIPVPEAMKPWLRDDIAEHAFGQLGKFNERKMFENNMDNEVKKLQGIEVKFYAIGCQRLLQGHNRCYPLAIRQFYANLRFNSYNTEVRSEVFGVEISLTAAKISEILGVPCDGHKCVFNESKYRDAALKELFDEEVLVGGGREIHGTSLNLFAKTVNRFSQFNIFPKGTHFPEVRKDTLIFIYCLWKGIRANVADLMLRRFCEPLGFHLYFPCYLSLIFDHFKVPTEMEQVMTISIPTFKMGIVNRMKPARHAPKRRGIEECKRKERQGEEEEFEDSDDDEDIVMKEKEVEKEGGEGEEEGEEPMSLRKVCREVYYGQMQSHYLIDHMTAQTEGMNLHNKAVAATLKTKHYPIQIPNYDDYVGDFHEQYGYSSDEGPEVQEEATGEEEGPSHGTRSKSKDKGKAPEVVEPKKKKSLKERFGFGKKKK